MLKKLFNENQKRQIEKYKKTQLQEYAKRFFMKKNKRIRFASICIVIRKILY